MSSNNLLVELFVEELPPKALKNLGHAFSSVLAESLRLQDLSHEDSVVTSYATPRRLAAHITHVAAKAADKPVAQKLMPVSIGLDAEGKPTAALLKKLSALGADENAVANLRTDNDGKADTLYLDTVQTGASLAEGLQKALEDAIAKLPIPKVMTYQLHDNCEQPGWDSVHFVRPVHGLLAMHGDEVVPVCALGLRSSNTTHGHRFEASSDTITVNHADSYVRQLSDEGAVIASFEDRRAEIVKQLDRIASELDLRPVEDEALLDEVTALVERPNVLLGQFEQEFLEVPQECLILTMKANQKYFPLLDAQGMLTNKFLIVSNISPTDPSQVIGGNERVVRPRLADAKFFFDQDRKNSLESRVSSLAKVVYHNKLGTQGERVLRVQAIAKAIGQELGGTALAAHAAQAALLAKADLTTDMVGEFPELQGIMGRYYAQHDGLDNEIAYAIEDHYKPRFAGDDLPRNMIGTCVALADKLETLVGLFGIGEKPTGEKDPFALRRHALGVIRILTEKSLPLELDRLIAICLQAFESDLLPKLDQKDQDSFAQNIASTLQNFVFDRLAGSLREQHYSAQEVDAVLALRPQRISDIGDRLAAVRAFAALPEAESLSAACPQSRISRFLQKMRKRRSSPPCMPSHRRSTHCWQTRITPTP
jgi:glycyl-tRNA synthetase beta chain